MVERHENRDHRDVFDTGIARRKITPESTTAEYDFLEIVAELEETEVDELPSLYTCVDHFVEQLFKDPPAADAQLEITFSYAGYRITMDKKGYVELVRVKDSLEGF